MMESGISLFHRQLSSLCLNRFNDYWSLIYTRNSVWAERPGVVTGDTVEAAGQWLIHLECVRVSR